MKSAYHIGGSVLLGVILIAAAFSARGTNAIPEQQVGSVVVAPESQRQYFATIDSDADGMGDWQEELLGTDPLAPNEKPERLANPTNDMRAYAESLEETPYSAPTTYTEKFARTFVKEIIKKNAAGEPPDAHFVLQAAETLEQTVWYKTYTLNDLSLVNSSDTEALRLYGNTLGSTLNMPTSDRGQHPIIILQNAVLNKDPDELQKLDAFITDIQFLVDELLTMNTPLIISEQHLALLNAYTTIYQATEKLKLVFDDPIISLTHLLSYNNQFTSLAAAGQIVSETLIKNGVIFEQNEPGIILKTY